MKTCNFCGKTQDQVKAMITSVDADICSDCVFICARIIIANADKYVELEYPKKEEGGEINEN